MPVNYQQIQPQIRDYCRQMAGQQRTLQDRLELARQQLQIHSADPDRLRAILEAAVAANPMLRCAMPASDMMNLSVPLPSAPPPDVLLGADGSQVEPSRHEAVEYGLINVGAIRIPCGKAEAPREVVDTHLLSLDELHPESGPVGEGVIALQRDLNERRLLARLAENEPGIVVTLTDGPLELFREPKEQKRYQELLDEYLKELDFMASMNVVTAGYVDRPVSNLLVTLLELPLLSDVSRAGHEHPLHLVRDSMLFAEMLKPGERSAVFGIQSGSAQRFTGHKALHFFYLNVAQHGKPQLARVEIPAWVARWQEGLNCLHAVLVAQCRQMGARPFPYVLHRAHEVAVVGLDEKEQLTGWITKALLEAGVPVDGVSNKQSGKNAMNTHGRYTP